MDPKMSVIMRFQVLHDPNDKMLRSIKLKWNVHFVMGRCSEAIRSLISGISLANWIVVSPVFLSFRLCRKFGLSCGRGLAGLSSASPSKTEMVIIARQELLENYCTPRIAIIYLIIHFCISILLGAGCLFKSSSLTNPVHQPTSNPKYVNNTNLKLESKY